MYDSTKKYLHPVSLFCWHAQVATAAKINSSGSYNHWGGTYPALIDIITSTIYIIASMNPKHSQLVV